MTPTGTAMGSISAALGALAIPDAVLPAQFWSVRGKAQTPETRLLTAVLLSALNDHRFYRRCLTTAARRYVENVELWLDGAVALVSFSDVCAGLRLSESAVREAVLHGPGGVMHVQHVVHRTGQGKQRVQG